MAKIHPRCKFTPRVYICTGVYIVHMNEAKNTLALVQIFFNILGVMYVILMLHDSATLSQRANMSHLVVYIL